MHEVLDTQHKAERDTESQRPVRARAYEPASRVDASLYSFRMELATGSNYTREEEESQTRTG